MNLLHSWKTRFRKTFYWKNTRNGQNHARRRLPWEAFATTSYNRNLCNFHTKRWLHLVTIVNDNISDTKTIHGPRKTLQIPQKKMNPFQVCPRKIVKTHARKNVRRDVFEIKNSHVVLSFELRQLLASLRRQRLRKRSRRLLAKVRALGHMLLGFSGSYYGSSGCKSDVSSGYSRI